MFSFILINTIFPPLPRQGYWRMCYHISMYAEPAHAKALKAMLHKLGYEYRAQVQVSDETCYSYTLFCTIFVQQCKTTSFHLGAKR